MLMCVDLVRVDYRPEGGSLMMYTVDNTTATSGTLPNLQCNTEYNISVYVRGGINDTRSAHVVASLSERGIYLVTCKPCHDCTYIVVSPQPLPLPLKSLLSSSIHQVSEYHGSGLVQAQLPTASTPPL